MSSNGTKPPPTQNGQPQQPKAETPVSIAQAFLNTRVKHIEDVLPPAMKGQGDRLIKRALLTMSKNANLMNCTAESFYHCVLAGAELGLAIDGKLAHAVPYGKVAQFQIDYKGMVAVARRTQTIKNTYARLVYDDDEFKLWSTDGVDHFEHRPGPRKGAVVGAYAVVIFPDDCIQVEWMVTHELDAIQSRSKAGSGPWKSDPGEMRKKTVLKRLLKMFMDSDSYLVSAYIADEEEDYIEGEASPSVPATPPTGRVHHNRLTGEMPMPANFNGVVEERELEPVQQPSSQQQQQTSQQAAPTSQPPAPQQQPAPVNDEREIKRQELIGWLNDQLNQERPSSRVLDEVGRSLRENAAWLGPDIVADMQRRFQAKTGAVEEAFVPVRRGRNF